MMNYFHKKLLAKINLIINRTKKK